MVYTRVSAQTVATHPVSVFTLHDGGIIIKDKRISITTEHKQTLNNAQTADHLELGLGLFTLCESTVEDMGKVWLEVDVQETDDSKPLVPVILTVINEVVLEELQQFHGNKIQDTRQQGKVLSLAVCPACSSKTSCHEERGHRLIETHAEIEIEIETKRRNRGELRVGKKKKGKQFKKINSKKYTLNEKHYKAIVHLLNSVTTQ
jgi:hypothetical protein